MAEKGEDEQEEERVPDELIEWERVPNRRHLNFSDTLRRSFSDSQTQSGGWSMVTIREPNLERENDRSIVFPPINHEGLHIPSSPSLSSSSSSDHEDYDHHGEGEKEEHKNSCPPNDENVWGPPSALAAAAVSRPRMESEVARWRSYWFKMWCDKVAGTVFSLHRFAVLRGANWSFCSATAVLLAWWFCAMVRRRRQRFRVRRESRDHLIRMIKERDEKISQLLHQIAQMNQMLLSLHKDSFSKA